MKLVQGILFKYTSNERQIRQIQQEFWYVNDGFINQLTSVEKLGELKFKSTGITDHAQNYVVKTITQTPFKKKKKTITQTPKTA